MTDSLVGFSRSKYGLIIGENTAEEMKIKIGSAAPAEKMIKIWSSSPAAGSENRSAKIG